jgi:hypothetical protein
VDDGVSRTSQLLQDLDFGNTWLRWCDRRLNWSALTSTRFDVDSLAGSDPLHVREFMDAYRAAGADVTQVRRTRSFDLDVSAGTTRVNIFVELGRGINTEECYLRVFRHGAELEGQMLHSIARDILLRQTSVDHLYPRPIIMSRSHLEVTSRELVATMHELARRY